MNHDSYTSIADWRSERKTASRGMFQMIRERLIHRHFGHFECIELRGFALFMYLGVIVSQYVTYCL